MGKEVVNSGETIDENINEQTLHNLLKELGELEKSLDNTSDGIVGGNSDDSEVDKKYREEIEKANNLKTKISIVNELLFIFGTKIELKSIFNSEGYKNLVNSHPKHKDLVDNLLINQGNLGASNETFDRVSIILNHAEDDNLLGSILREKGVSGKTIFEEYYNYLLYKGTTLENLESFRKDSFTKENWDRIIRDFKEGFYIERILKNKSLEVLNGNEDSNFILAIIKYSDSIKDLEMFDKIFNEESKKEKPDLKKISDYVMGIGDLTIRSKFVNKIDEYFKKTNFNFQEIYIEYSRNKNFNYLNTFNIDKNSLDNYSGFLAFMTDDEIKILEPLLSNLFSKNIKGIDGINAIGDFIDKLSKSSFISVNYYFFHFLSYLGNSIANNEAGDIKEMQEIDKLGEKVSSLIDTMNKKAGLNIKGMEIKGEFNNRYKDFCNEYLKLKPEDRPNLETYLGICEIDYGKGKINIPPQDIKQITQSFYGTTEETKIEMGKDKKEISPKKNLEEKYGSQINELVNSGARIDENGNLEISSPIKLGRNESIKMGQDGALIYMNSLGYNFKFEKDLNKSAGKLFEIKAQMDFFDTVGFGYFGEDFKKMIEIIKSTGTLIGNESQISITEGVGFENDFLDIQEMIKLCSIFKKIGFLGEDVNPNNLSNTPLTKTQFVYNMENLGNKYGENNFYPNGQFNEIAFKKVIVDLYSKEK